MRVFLPICKVMSLNLLQKSDIISKLDNGISGARLAKEFNVAKSTISYIKKHKSDILNAIAANFDDAKTSKNLTEIRCKNLEIMLYDWIKIRQRSNIDIDNKTVKNKAIEIYAKLNPSHANKFKAGDKWLQKFKRRYGLQFRAGENVKNDQKHVQHSMMNVSMPIDEADDEMTTHSSRPESPQYSDSNSCRCASNASVVSESGVGDEIELSDDDEIVQKEGKEMVSSCTDDNSDDDENSGFVQKKEKMAFSDSDFENDVNDGNGNGQNNKVVQKEEKMVSSYTSDDIDDDNDDDDGDRDSDQSDESRSSDEEDDLQSDDNDSDDDETMVNDDFDPNELCERLRAILKSVDPVHLHKFEEMQKIISTLRAANIIY